jgi:hypothetical protein
MMKNPKGTITLKEAFEMQKGKTDIVTKMGLRIAAKRDGFMSAHKGIGREKYLIDIVKFKKWIKNGIISIPKDFVLVGEAAKELYITRSYVYSLIKKYKILIKKAGGGKGKKYVNFSALKRKLSEKNRRIDNKKNAYEPSSEELRKAVLHFREYCVFLKTKSDWRNFLKTINSYNNFKRGFK